MHPLLTSKKNDIVRLCARWNVHRLSVFGSASANASRFDPSRSDVDFVVEFRAIGELDYADCYFGLKQDLELILGLPVDLVEAHAVKNPIFLVEIDKSRELVYAA